MKNVLCNALLLLGLTSNVMVQAESNPFFGKYKTPFETPPFDKIKTEHYEPAFKRGIAELKADIEKIANNSEPATFENTIVALDRSGELLNRVSGAFFNVLSANANDEMMEISQRISPDLTESSNNIYLNEKLFARVKAVYDQRQSLNLSVEDTPEFAEALKRELTGGTPFAAARARAARALLGESAAVLDTPNDLLAVEYIRAAAKLGYTFDYTPVRREGSTHDGAGSASELRALLRAGESLAGRVPGEVWEVLRRADETGRGFVSPERLRTAYLSRLREKTPEDFAAVPDAAEGLHFRLYEAARRGSSPEEIADLAKSKRYAHARLRRMVMCAALGVRAGDANGVPPYIRVLAFDARGAALLREMKTSAALPVVVKSARVKDENESIQRLFDLGSRAHDLYVLGWKNRALQAADADYRATPFCSVGNNRNSVHDNQECV